MNPSNYRSLVVNIALAGLLSGCVYEKDTAPAGIPVTQIGVNDPGFVAGTGIESQDLVAVTDKMSRSILGIPQITNAVGTPCIVLDPVKNETRFPINKDIFLTRIQDELIRQAGGRVTFLARDRMEALQHEKELKQSGQVTASADPAAVEFKGADFFLTGTLQGMGTRTDAGTSDYILYSFQLIDARTSAIVWADSAEIKKQGQSDAAYR
jgi:PBP1b-binding outer membrane lipoprotein LpoB